MPAAKSAPRADAAVSTSRPTITARQDTTPTPPQESKKLAPGTAWVNARVLSVEYSEDWPGSISLQITKVRGYGPSTPPIPPDSKLSINVLGFVKANTQYKSVFKKGDEISAILTYRKGLQIQDGQNSGDSWAISDIKEQGDHE
ncbi:MAG TPA: hypothetical protein VJ964_14010 [Balneolaceae bacterium]|nr:hypothetical protein [Balneolaceae bacterium]